MRNDIKGKGYFGAPRGNRIHNGVDIEATPGQSINAPVSGVVIRNNVDPYGNGQFGGVLIRADDGSEVKVMYIDPTVKVGDRVEAGKSPVGKAQDVRDRHGPKMTPHVHIEGKQNGQYYDVTPYALPGGNTKP